MSIMEAIRSSVSKEAELGLDQNLSAESTTVEWMRYMRSLRDKAIQVDIALENDTSEKAIEDYLYNANQVDYSLGATAEVVIEYISTHGAKTFDKKGKANDKSDDIYAPLEISVLEDAVSIFERFPTENSQALVEALFIKYGNENYWNTTILKERVNALLGHTTNAS